jgi:hypothetical protein
MVKLSEVTQAGTLLKQAFHAAESNGDGRINGGAELAKAKRGQSPEIQAALDLIWKQAGGNDQYTRSLGALDDAIGRTVRELRSRDQAGGGGLSERELRGAHPREQALVQVAKGLRAPKASSEDPKVQKAFDKLVAKNQAVLTQRGAGLSLIETPNASAVPVRDRMDIAAAAAGLAKLGADWREVTGSEARSIVRRALETELAYGTKAMPKSVAERISKELFALLDEPDAKFFTNLTQTWTPGTQIPAAWNSVSSAVFDVAVGVVRKGSTAAFHVGDND